jgi:TonB family protein
MSSSSKLTFAMLTLWLGTMALHAQEAVLRLTQEEALKAAVAKPQPDYPPIARQLKLQGRVELEVSIGLSGSVDGAKILTGNPALTGAAVNAVKRWRFEPFLADGKAVRAVAILVFTFKL